ncbi:MAG: RNA chaperone Hfq [Acidobacteriota bacterium]
MRNRRLIRPNLAEIKERNPPKPRRKPAPPEVTNAEAFYYVKQINSETPVHVVLTDGEEIEGRIEWYDRGSIKLKRDNGPDLLLMKHAISYIFKTGDVEGDAEGRSASASAAD